MIDGREVKDSNVSIMGEWSSNGYKEEGAKLNQESLHTCDFANASYFFNIIINRSQISQGAIFVKTVNCITTNPLKSISRVTGATISVNLYFTGTK